MVLFMTSDNKYYSENTNFIEYFVAMTNEMVRQYLMAFGFITKKHIYELLGFELEDRDDETYHQEDYANINICVSEASIIDAGVVNKAYLIEIYFAVKGS